VRVALKTFRIVDLCDHHRPVPAHVVFVYLMAFGVWALEFVFILFQGVPPNGGNAIAFWILSVATIALSLLVFFTRRSPEFARLRQLVREGGYVMSLPQNLLLLAVLVGLLFLMYMAGIRRP
jgi:hypothetical protein